MTQHEDDAARLAREWAKAIYPPYVMRPMHPSDSSKRATDHWNKVNESARQGRIAHAATMLEEKLRAHLSERDARERMVREAAERALHWINYNLAVEKRGMRTPTDDSFTLRAALRAALSAKSDEQTPTPTEPSQ